MLETQIKTALQKTPEQSLHDLRMALENIEIVAQNFGSNGMLHHNERARYSLHALDVIKAMAKCALRDS